MFEDRIIFMGVQVDDTSADDIMAQLLVLESQDPNRDVMMYINSPGGSMTAMTAIYDTMQYIKPDVQTVCLGQAASAAAILLAAGAKGKRLMLPNARVLIHQPAIDQGFGKATEIEIQAKEMLRMREWLENTLAKHTGRDVEKIRKDIEVDTFLTAPEAKGNTALSTKCWNTVAERRICEVPSEVASSQINTPAGRWQGYAVLQ